MLLFNDSDKYFNLLIEQLWVEIDAIIVNKFTIHQKRIIDLYLQGKKQQEIADIVGISQTAVSSCINGVPDYRRGGKVYGGIINKLRKNLFYNKKAIEIITELKKNDYRP
jgi:hypothetical protein